MELLSKTRVINRLLQRSTHAKMEFDELTGTLRDIVAANVFLLDASGRLIGHSLAETYDDVSLPDTMQVPPDFTAKILYTERSQSNLREVTPFCSPASVAADRTAYVTIIPIDGVGERIGTLLLTKHTAPFTEEDTVLAEYSATMIGFEMMRLQATHNVQVGRDRSVAQMAVSSLSFSELEAVEHIFGELEGREGLLVASRIADRVGITRSVIVNALRKLESAGVVEARSLGMKGTHIKILNDRLLPLLADMKTK
ncbi:MAG TPA: GTP-sensing pleiotropic transcriptional regulator CodY [Bacilli bacterium]|nr:GTP-sensing pleiotropic transcriptional regulator CodY [Bacilli bacterium]